MGEAAGAGGVFSHASLRWFPHDADAAFDPKCRLVIRSLGPAGYGRYWLLMEALATEEGHALRADTERDMTLLGPVLELDSAQEVSDFLRRLTELGLVYVRDGCVRSHRMDRNAEYFGGQRKGGSKGGRRRATRASGDS